MTDKLNGKPQVIDTEFERSQLEYRPKTAYEKDVTYEVEFPVEATLDDPAPETSNPDKYRPQTDVGKQFQSFAVQKELLREELDWLSNELRDVRVPLLPVDMERIVNSSPGLAGKLENGYIDFKLYDQTFTDPEEPGNALIQDVVTEYAEDVEGSLELEAYEDMKELELTLDEGFYLYSELVLKEFLEEELPEVPELDVELLKKIDEKVLAHREQFKEAQKEAEKEEAVYYESLRTEYGSPQFFEKTETFQKKKRPFDLGLRKEKTTKEMMALVDELLVGTQVCANPLKSQLVLGGDLDEEEVMKVLENQASTDEGTHELMKLSQLSLKLQINKQIQEKRQYRDVLKNVNSLSRKKRAHDELVASNRLRNKLYLSLYDTLQYLNGPAKKSDVELFLNNVSGGMELVQGEYDAFLRDISLMYRSEYDIRSEKITKTIQKHYARTGYGLVSDYLQK